MRGRYSVLIRNPPKNPDGTIRGMYPALPTKRIAGSQQHRSLEHQTPRDHPRHAV